MLPTILHVQGDTLVRDIVVKRDGVAVDVSGWAWWVTCKQDPGAADAAALFQLSTVAGTIVPVATGRLRATGAPALTVSAAPGRYHLDIQFKDAAGIIRTGFRGYLRIVPQITRAT
ncbi:MAG: hypothetical protein JNK23_10640 [Opitutaceae bacterium]|nr:hypothetical protein [Opitutaceae bacterium]